MDTDPIAAWLARIPGACNARPVDVVIQHLACLPPPADPEGACIVEQRDRETGTVVDRFVFAGAQLVRHDTTVSDIQHETTTYAYDEHQHLVRTTQCMTSSGGDAGWHPWWREPMVRHDGPFASVDRTDRVYARGGAGPVARVPAYANVISTARFDGKVTTTDMKVCYAYDARGRRHERYQVYRMDDRPLALDTEIRSYEYGDAGVRSITYSSLNLDRRDDETLAVRFHNAWTASFSRDRRGLVTAVEASGGSTTTYRYDAKGRLTSYLSAMLAWDARDRLVSITGMGARYDREYRYDAAGRIDEARFGPDHGYRVTYGAGCAAGFAHPALTPNADHFLYYEGKDTL